MQPLSYKNEKGKKKKTLATLSRLTNNILMQIQHK